jgi:hypothetical protein
LLANGAEPACAEDTSTRLITSCAFGDGWIGPRTVIVPLTEPAVAAAVELALAAPLSVGDDVDEPQPAKASTANDITDKTILRMGVSLVTELDRTRKPVAWGASVSSRGKR